MCNYAFCFTLFVEWNNRGNCTRSKSRIRWKLGSRDVHSVNPRSQVYSPYVGVRVVIR